MKKQLLSLFFLLPAAAIAEQQWTITDQRGAVFAIDSVTCLLASDTEEAFTIVLNNGTLQTGVTEVRVAKLDLDAISAVSAANPSLSVAIEAHSRLSLTGCAKGTPVRLYSVGGQLLRTEKAEGQTTTVDVSSLQGGVYIVKVGDTAIKFSKK